MYLWTFLVNIQRYYHAADNPQLIKINVIYLYMKPEVKKADTTAMTTAL